MNYVSDLLEILFPRLCPVCERRLLPAEEYLCLHCLLALPRVGDANPGNIAESRMFGRIPFEHGASYSFYSPKGLASHIVIKSKYLSMPWYNSQLTHLFVQELRQAGSAWPYDIDLIVPVPIHWRRRVSRGYNQSVAIAEALSDEWNIPVDYDSLQKKAYTTSQVGLKREDRLAHVKGSFVVRHPERLQGRHVLIVDDVLTTGATLEAVSSALLEAVPGLRISFFTLTLTQ